MLKGSKRLDLLKVLRQGFSICGTCTKALRCSRWYPEMWQKKTNGYIDRNPINYISVTICTKDIEIDFMGHVKNFRSYLTENLDN